MNIQRVKQGARITFYNGIYLVLMGFFYVFFVRIIMTGNFNSIDQLWGFFTKYNTKIANLFYFFNVMVGIFMVSEGIVIMYLSDFIIKRKEKMTWVVLFLSGIICWAGLLTISILFKNWILIVSSGVGWISFVIGMLLPIKYYLEKNYREY